MTNFYASRSTTELIAIITGILFALWYISTQAGRLDRLHHRVHMASAALDAQLARRAGIAAELAFSLELDPVSQAVLSQTAHDALAATTLPWDERANIENQLTETIDDILSDTVELVVAGEVAVNDVNRVHLKELFDAWEALQLSRRFHADAVRACLVIRHQKFVRWLHLAGHARMPKTHDFNDELPKGLTALLSA